MQIILWQMFIKSDTRYIERYYTIDLLTTSTPRVSCPQYSSSLGNYCDNTVPKSPFKCNIVVLSKVEHRPPKLVLGGLRRVGELPYLCPSNHSQSEYLLLGRQNTPRICAEETKDK